jgi:hypothetical protein
VRYSLVRYKMKLGLSVTIAGIFAAMALPADVLQAGYDAWASFPTATALTQHTSDGACVGQGVQLGAPAPRAPMTGAGITGRYGAKAPATARAANSWSRMYGTGSLSLGATSGYANAYPLGNIAAPTAVQRVDPTLRASDRNLRKDPRRSE